MNSAIHIPDSQAALTPAWLTATLRAGGHLENGVVQAISATRIGEDEAFTGGLLLRLALEYDQDETGAPTSLIAKIAPADPAMRAAMKAMNSREAHFYLDLAPEQPQMPVPHCFYGQFDEISGESILLLQDLTDYRAVEFIAGCAAVEAEYVVGALARIHAAWWDSPRLRGASGLSALAGFSFGAWWADYPEAVTALLPDVVIPESFWAIGRYVAANEAIIFKALYEDAPLTCIHRDSHVDNVLFGSHVEHEPVFILDWQLFGRGRGVHDVAFFLITSVPSEVRRRIEKDVVRRYHEVLVGYGIQDYSLAQCWFDYKLSAVGRLFVTVGATLIADNSTPHKRRWRQVDLARLLAFCADHEIERFLAAAISDSQER